MATSHKTSWLRTAKAIAWSFVGLRGRKDYEEDIKKLSPLHLVAAGLVGVFLFVGALVALVNWVVPG
ncbi:MAG: DUF2970 domain-containing protein [Pseudomonadota bacterium]